EGFVNALGAGLIRIKNDLEKLWNGLTGDGFNTNDELKQMEEGKKQAIAAALGEWDKMKTEDMSQDILSNFNADTREVTDAKIQAMRDAKLDTTQIEKQVAVLRQQDAAYKAQLKADSLAQQSAGKDTQRQYIAQFGAVYSNSLGNQAPKSSSFLDNLLGNLYADEGKGNYVPYNVGGDYMVFEGIGEGGSAGYAQALNDPAKSDKIKNNGVYPHSESQQGYASALSDPAITEGLENSNYKKYRSSAEEFALLSKAFGKYGNKDALYEAELLYSQSSRNDMTSVDPKIYGGVEYKYNVGFSDGSSYGKTAYQNSDAQSAFMLSSAVFPISGLTAKVFPFIKKSLTAEMAINGTVGAVSSMTTNALVNNDVDFFSLNNLKTGGFGFLNAAISTKYNSFNGLFVTGLTTTTLNEVVSGNRDVGNISAKALVGGGMNMGFGKGLKYQIAPYEGGRAMAGFQKYVFPATVAGWYEMSNELIFNEIDKKKK
ncbi:MAG TPA: hypothetical protein PK158_13600, partial [Spirochaetota bacterium]|nr:hypothetical protein [Spirochaetota bacterium]